VIYLGQHFLLLIYLIICHNFSCLFYEKTEYGEWYVIGDKTTIDVFIYHGTFRFHMNTLKDKTIRRSVSHGGCCYSSYTASAPGKANGDASVYSASADAVCAV
jgi:hypothetical protein